MLRGPGDRPHCRRWNGRRHRRRAVRHVARCHGHRESQPERAIFVVDVLLIGDVDRDLFTGANVGDGDGEEIRPLLRQERRFLPFALGLRVDLLGLFALLDLPFNYTLADGHAQRVNGRIFRQRKRVDRLRACRFGIAEALRHFAAQNQPAHVKLDVGLHCRCGDVEARSVGLQQHHAALHLLHGDKLALVLLRESGNRNQDGDEDCQSADHCLFLR